METGNTIIRDTTGEIIAIVAHRTTAYCKNITGENVTAAELDETGAGWTEITLEQAAEIISAGTIIDEFDAVNIGKNEFDNDIPEWAMMFISSGFRY